MKVISEVTEEFIEVPENREILVKEEMNALVTSDVLETYIQVEKLQKEIDEWKEKNKEKMLEIFKRYGIKSFINENISITYKAPYQKRIVDTQKLKDDGVYDFYTKTSNQKESIQISCKG